MIDAQEAARRARDALISRDVPAADAAAVADLLRGGAADAVDGGQADLGVLLRRDVDASNTCHGVLCLLRGAQPGSALALLVARVGADHAHHALAADDLAIAAHLLDGCGYFHDLLLDL